MALSFEIGLAEIATTLEKITKQMLNIKNRMVLETVKFQNTKTFKSESRGMITIFYGDGGLLYYTNKNSDELIFLVNFVYNRHSVFRGVSNQFEILKVSLFLTLKCLSKVHYLFQSD